MKVCSDGKIWETQKGRNWLIRRKQTVAIVQSVRKMQVIVGEWDAPILFPQA